MTDPTQPEIVRLTLDDWPAYRQLRLEALADAAWMFGHKPEQERAFTEDDYRARLSIRAQWAARVDGTFVGTIGGVFRDDSGIPELTSMWVHADARGRGIGGLLVRAMLDWAQAQGCDQVKLWVTQGNGPAERLYARNGFVPTGESRPGTMGDPSRIEIQMVCTLAVS